jgi:hypothetical protein
MPQLQHQRLAESGELRSFYRCVPGYDANGHGRNYHRNDNGHWHRYYHRHYEPAAHDDPADESAAASLSTK